MGHTVHTYCLSQNFWLKGESFMEESKLNQLYEWGAKLYIGGCPATPGMVDDFILKNKKSLKPDFVFDELGNLDEIRY